MSLRSDTLDVAGVNVEQKKECGRNVEELKKLREHEKKYTEKGAHSVTIFIFELFWLGTN